MNIYEGTANDGLPARVMARDIKEAELLAGDGCKLVLIESIPQMKIVPA